MYPCIAAFEVDRRYCAVIYQADFHSKKRTAGRTPAIALCVLFLHAHYLRIRRPLLLASMVRQGDPSWKAALAAFTAKSTSALHGHIKVTVSRDLTFVLSSICHNKVTLLKIFDILCKYTFCGLHFFSLYYIICTMMLCQRPSSPLINGHLWESRGLESRISIKRSDVQWCLQKFILKSEWKAYRDHSTF